MKPTLPKLPSARTIFSVLGSKLKLVQYSVGVLISYLFVSVQNNSLHFLNQVFNEKITNDILNHSLFIMVFFIVVYIMLECIILFSNKDKNDIKLYNNICKYIYEYIGKQCGQRFNRHIRVTMFKAMNENTEKVYIKAVGRYDIGEPKKKTKITFAPDEGIAGKCFAKQVALSEHLPEYIKNNDAYYKVSQNNYNLKREEVDKLNIKPCEILCIPIKYSDGNKTWGVLSIDSEKPGDIFNESIIARKIEVDLVEHYKVIFIREDDKE